MKLIIKIYWDESWFLSVCRKQMDILKKSRKNIRKKEYFVILSESSVYWSIENGFICNSEVSTEMTHRELIKISRKIPLWYHTMAMNISMQFNYVTLGYFCTKPLDISDRDFTHPWSIHHLLLNNAWSFNIFVWWWFLYNCNDFEYFIYLLWGIWTQC